jgi:hypothetical protein
LGRIVYLVLLVVLVGGLWMYADSRKAIGEAGLEYAKPLITAVDSDQGADVSDDTLAPEEPAVEEAGGQ